MSVITSLSPRGYHESLLPKPVNSTSMARLTRWASVRDDARPLRTNGSKDYAGVNIGETIS
jgi:hypothetical protein